MMINVCRDCGHERQGCTGCYKNCPACGGILDRVDYVQHVLKKQRLEESKKQEDENS